MARTVTLTLDAPVAEGDTVEVTYTPGTNKIQDIAGNDAASLTTEAVTNNTNVGGLLSWDPDVVCPLSSPVTVDETDISGGTLTLGTSTDYIIDISSYSGPLTISGGRNYRFIGGHLTMTNSAPLSETGRTNLYLFGFTGVAFIEGLLLDAESQGAINGINVKAAAGDALYLQNIRIEDVKAPSAGVFSTFHPDCFFTWAPPAEVYIDHLTGESDYQAMTISHVPTEGGTGAESWDIRNVNVKQTAGRTTFFAGFWPTDGPHVPYGPDTVYTFDECYVQDAINGLEHGVMPEVKQEQNGANWHFYGTQSGEGGIRNGWDFFDEDDNPIAMPNPATTGDYVTWSDPADNSKTGRVTYGPPPGGDFVLAGDVGSGYVTPGYV